MNGWWTILKLDNFNFVYLWSFLAFDIFFFIGTSFDLKNSLHHSFQGIFGGDNSSQLLFLCLFQSFTLLYIVFLGAVVVLFCIMKISSSPETFPFRKIGIPYGIFLLSLWESSGCVYFLRVWLKYILGYLGWGECFEWSLILLHLDFCNRLWVRRHFC